jgi:hypothetical protein
MLPHRSSMMSLAGGATPNASTASLPQQVKNQQSVGYRKAVMSMPPPGVRDPMLVLESILGVPVGATKQEAKAVDKGLPELSDAEGIEFGELSLEEFVKQAEEEGTKKPPRVRQYSEQSVEECMQPFSTF